MQLSGTTCDHSIGVHIENDITDINTENGHHQLEQQIYVCNTCEEVLDSDPQHDCIELANEAYADSQREISN